MKDTKTNLILFAVVTCCVCSTLLALASSSLKELQEKNRRLYIKKNILKVAGLKGEGTPMSDKDVEALYDRNIVGKALDEEGNEVAGVSPDDAKAMKERKLHPLYIRMEDGKPAAYVLYVQGKGLWSTVKGYLALEADAGTVTGVAFFEHGETPGLGGEIEKDWFSGQWKGKKIFNPEDQLVPITIIKGKVEESKHAKEPEYFVDGISGATLTGSGINKFMERDLKVYEPFLRKVRKG